MLATDLEKVLTGVAEAYFCSESQKSQCVTGGRGRSSSLSKVRNIFGLGASRVTSSAAEVAIPRVNSSNKMSKSAAKGGG